MDRESILKDLDIFAPEQWKKYAVRMPLTRPVEETVAQTTQTIDVPPVDDSNTNIYNMFKQKLETAGFLNISLHNDKSTIICTCAVGHSNMINIRDIAAAVCKTCNFGFKFANLARAEMENELGVKLSLLEGNKQIAIYTTQDAKIKLICDKSKDKISKVEQDGDVAIYTIAPNMLSVAKIKQVIKSLIRPTDDIAAKKNKYPRDELPICPDMADKLKRDGANPTLVNMTANIVDSKSLYIEDCLVDGFLNNIYKS